MKYFLIVHHRSEGKLLRCDEVPRGDAIGQRFALERQYAGDPDIEIVVLGAESLDAIKLTHGRYFYTVAELAERATGLLT